MKPIRVYPYEPKDQTPKFVMIKNKHAPSKDPEILLNMFFEKNLEVRPIKITLPHVKSDFMKAYDQISKYKSY